MGQVLEEWENKIKEEQMNYEEEIEVLRQEIRNKEDKAISLENEIDYRNKTVENLEKLLKETKENLVLAQNNTNSSLEQQMNSFTNERRNLQDKIDLLSIEINKKDKELNNSEQLKLQLTQNLQKKENQLENIKKDYIEEKSTVLKKLEETKERYIYLLINLLI